MSAVLYRFPITSLDGLTPLPAPNDYTITAEGDGAFLVQPVSSPAAPFAALGLISIAALERKRQGRGTGVDGYRIQQVALAVVGGAPVDVAIAVVSRSLAPAALPLGLFSTLVIAALDSVRAISPGWPIWGPDGTQALDLLEVAPLGAGNWVVEIVAQKLPELACCFEGYPSGGPPPPPPP